MTGVVPCRHRCRCASHCGSGATVVVVAVVVMGVDGYGLSSAIVAVLTWQPLWQLCHHSRWHVAVEVVEVARVAATMAVGNVVVVLRLVLSAPGVVIHALVPLKKLVSEWKPGGGAGHLRGRWLMCDVA